MVGKVMNGMSRRELLRNASAAFVVGGLGKLSFGQTPAAGTSPDAATSKAFPEKFLWKATTPTAISG
jgi:hypothetical protein